MTEAQLDVPGTDELGRPLAAWRIFWAMIDHDALHMGAIAQLRDAD